VAELFVVGDRPSTEEQVRERALAALAQESRILLDDGVVAEPQDVDLCMLLGAGWPFHLGGITPYLDRTGVSERVTGQRFLPPGVADVAGQAWLTAVAGGSPSPTVNPSRSPGA
jgi:hypothetical protein